MGPGEGLAPWIDLSLVPGLGSRHFSALLSAFGPPQDILAATRAQLARVVPDTVAARITARGREKTISEAVEWAAGSGHAVITLADDTYPRQLLEIHDPPILLYVHGDPARISASSLAIVGSRNATPQGIANALAFGRTISDAGFAIVSGGALGIDSGAHRGGLAGRSSTVAVLGCGVNVLYPKRNEALLEEIAARGALVSEFALNTPPVAGNFPRRNRLISGLSRGCLVMEAALESGSLITARLAADQGREVFAVPGSIHSPLAKGCHSLIKQGAKLVETAGDVLEELGAVPVQAPLNISGPSEGLLRHMGYDPCDVDSLMARSGLTAESISAMLLQLELDGKICRLSGGLYQRKS